MKHKVLSHIFQRILIVIFFIMISAPALRSISGDKAVFSFTEKRSLAAFPQLPNKVSQVQVYFSKLDDYLNDHFGFREWMVYRYQREIGKRFNDTAISTKVMKGLDNWYFFTGSDILEDFTGKNLLNRKELNNWILYYREKSKWLKSRGIRYLLAIPPNKTSVYSRHIGEPWIDNRGTARLTQIKNQFSDSDLSTLLDLAPPLTERAREDDTLYFKSDSHWTPYGAYFAYLKIAEKIESLFQDIHFKKDFTFTPTITRTCEKKQEHCGDLTQMLLDYDNFEESYKKFNAFPGCARSSPFDLQLSDLSVHEKESHSIKICPEATLKAVVFRDSFFETLEPYFSENFKKVIYLWKYYDQKNIEEILRVFKPDIVIEEKIERRL